MKKVGPCMYVHKSNLVELFSNAPFYCGLISEAVRVAESNCWKYEVVKFDKSKMTVSLIDSPDWNTSKEPVVGDSLLVSLNNDFEPKVIKSRTKNKQIYHSKELFVAPNYNGFDVEAAKLRTKEWNAIPNLNKSIIGNQDSWFAILDTYGISR